MPSSVPLTISTDCTACGACLLTCPESALRPARHRPRVLAEACTSCGECVEVCPVDAITLADEAGEANLESPFDPGRPAG